jgi:hypothetical protein
MRNRFAFSDIPVVPWQKPDTAVLVLHGTAQPNLKVCVIYGRSNLNRSSGGRFYRDPGRDNVRLAKKTELFQKFE